MRSRFLIPVASTVWMLGCGRLPAGATLEPVPGGRPSVPPVAPGTLPSGQVVADFASFETGGWQNLTFRPWHRKVDYRKDTGPDGQAVIRATSDDAASMLVRLSSIDVRKTPILRWSWRVTGPVPGADERTRGGDDCAARLYVAWNLRGPEDIFRTEALVYTWGNTRRIGELGPSPYTRQVGMVTVRAGAAGAGSWQEETRDVLADYRAFFRREPPGPVSAIAFMTDTDQTHGRLVSWYGPVRAFQERPAP